MAPELLFLAKKDQIAVKRGLFLECLNVFYSNYLFQCAATPIVANRFLF